MGIKSQRILITGAAQRIGKALAEYFANQGWHVIAHYNRSQKEARELQEKIHQAGFSCDIIAADLLKEKEVQGLIPTINQRWGNLQVLINNAAVFKIDTLKTMTRQSWDQHMEVNLRAPFVLSQAFAAQQPLLEKSIILNILDQRVWNLTPYFTSYTLSKFGLWGLTQILALSLAPTIRVNAIGPGPTLPSSQENLEKFARFKEGMPLKHHPSLADICRAAQFLIECSSMTGQMIAIDSGQHLGWTLPDYLEHLTTAK